MLLFIANSYAYVMADLIIVIYHCLYIRTCWLNTEVNVFFLFLRRNKFVIVNDMPLRLRKTFSD